MYSVWPHSIYLVARLLLAMILGAVIGIERKMSKKHAGIRTYALVSLGASLFAVLSEEIYRYFLTTYGVAGSFDPSRIVSQIVVGTGFLGAGMVIFHQEKVSGLTSAAGIWVAAAIGAAVGVGAYVLAVATTVIALFILVVLRRYEDFIKDRKSGV